MRLTVDRPRILYVLYGNPASYPPAENAVSLFTEAGGDVRIVGSIMPGTEGLRPRAGPNIRVHLVRYRGGRLGHLVTYALFLVRAFRVLVWWRPNWVYASDKHAAVIGYLASLVPGVRVIYHEFDTPQAPGRYPTRDLPLVARCALTRRADVVVAPNTPRLDRLLGDSGRSLRNVIAWNCPLRREVPDLQSSGEVLRVLYHGSIGPQRLPFSVIEALAVAKIRHDLVISGLETRSSFGYVDRLLEEARRLGVRERVDATGAASHADLLRQAARCDVGLVLFPRESADPNMTSMWGASNKAFDYFAAGLPVLVSAPSEWEEACVAVGLGRACDPTDAVSISEALDWFATHRTEARNMGLTGRACVLRDWNFETQFQPVIDLVFGRPPQ